ncbi:hypothetical protein [Lentzea sp. NPDC059081]|uniref:hypothetical protein n=1 Tax=Lentzea sp. NPDC059081 TaxID=3346719 RepID=UPI0036C280A2
MGSEIDDEARRRLDDAMDERRLELELEWREVADRGGITYETLRAARRGKRNIPTRTRRAIEQALDWESGSVLDVLAGRRATPLGRARTPAADEILEARERILAASPQELVRMRSVVEEVLSKDEADEFMTRAIAMRERAGAGEDTASDAS